MKTIKQTKEYTIFQKRSGRYAVKNSSEKWVNGLDKAKILVENKLIETGFPKEGAAEEKKE